jgi:glutathione S-transferase
MILYHCIAARSFRPLWALEELGMEYELRVLPFPPRVRAKSYLDINPLGTVPAFVAGDTRMTESAAICQFLADRHPDAGLSVAPIDADYGAYLNYLHFGEATLTFPQTLLLRYGRFEPAQRLQPQVVADYQKWFLARLRSLAPRLEQSDYLCAGRFTVADISVGYALLLAEYLALDAAFPPSVAQYWQRLRARDGFTRARQAELDAASAQDVSLVPAPQAN